MEYIDIDIVGRNGSSSEVIMSMSHIWSCALANTTNPANKERW